MHTFELPKENHTQKNHTTNYIDFGHYELVYVSGVRSQIKSKIQITCTK